MSFKHVLLDENKNIVEIDDVLEWAELFQKSPERNIVKKTKIGNTTVSTILMPAVLYFSEEEKIQYFETCIFTKNNSEVIDRYHTFDEALDGHEKIVNDIVISKDF